MFNFVIFQSVYYASNKVLHRSILLKIYFLILWSSSASHTQTHVVVGCGTMSLCHVVSFFKPVSHTREHVLRLYHINHPTHSTNREDLISKNANLSSFYEFISTLFTKRILRPSNRICPTAKNIEKYKTRHWGS